MYCTVPLYYTVLYSDGEYLIVTGNVSQVKGSTFIDGEYLNVTGCVSHVFIRDVEYFYVTGCVSKVTGSIFM